MGKISLFLVVASLMAFGAAQPGEAQQPQIQGDVVFVSGGVAEDSQLAMEAARSQYNLHLLFAQQDTGGFFADVPVEILDSSGRTVLNTVSQGPYLYARLKPGYYRVTASHNGQAIAKTADLSSAGSVDLSYYWPGTSLSVPVGPSAPAANPAAVPAPAVVLAPPSSPQLPSQPQLSAQPGYISGGVDDSSQQEMQAVRGQYNLHLLFAQEGTGAYHANVPVRITDLAGGNVLSTVSSGPFLYARLPAGRYSVSAVEQGQTITKSVDVPAVGGVDLNFYWPGDSLPVPVGAPSAVVPASLSAPTVPQQPVVQQPVVQQPVVQRPVVQQPVGDQPVGGQISPQNQGQVTFVTGGVDDASQEEMQAMRGDYNLHLLFFQQGTNAYFAYVPVQIFDAAGRMVLNTVSDGPFLYARLPAGRYTVTAVHSGQTLSKSADVPAEGGIDLNYSWAGS